MSRPIKFRAWDIKLRKYVDQVHIYLDGNGDVFTWGDKPLDKSRFVIELSTGLKDKNGVEIYEGDIFKPAKGQDHRQQFVVEWPYDVAVFWDSEQPVLASYGEVIGNIYATPELLK